MGTIFEHEDPPRSPAEARLRDRFAAYLAEARICAAYTRRPQARYETETLTIRAARRRLTDASDALESELLGYTAMVATRT